MKLEQMMRCITKKPTKDEKKIVRKAMKLADESAERARVLGFRKQLETLFGEDFVEAIVAEKGIGVACASIIWDEEVSE